MYNPLLGETETMSEVESGSHVPAPADHEPRLPWRHSGTDPHVWGYVAEKKLALTKWADYRPHSSAFIFRLEPPARSEGQLLLINAGIAGAKEQRMVRAGIRFD